MTTDTTTADTDAVLTRVDHGVGFLTLNRPKSLNSLNQLMVDRMTEALTAWEHDDSIRAAVLCGAGERGLCAGGDVVAIYHSARGDGSAARRFWFDEYRLNAQISRFRKPYVALMDGIVMGGGVGVGAHGDVRIVTDHTKMGLPEVGIGFVPDVGGTYLLSRAPGSLGLHAAMTGVPFSGADAIALGFADHYVRHDQIAAFTQTLIDDGPDSAVAKHSIEPPASDLVAQRHWIDECYGHDTVAEIVSSLRDHDAAAANHTADVVAGRSPLALAVTLASVRRAAKLASLQDCLIQEYRVSCASLRSHDLVEGIRAQLVDKDRNPKWSPADVAMITPADVEAHFVSAEPDLTF